MRFEFKAAFLAFVISGVSWIAFADAGNQSKFKKMETEGWFFVEIFDCKFPIPNHYTLRADVSEYFFFNYNGQDFTLQSPMNIYIKDRSDDDIHPHSEKFDVKYKILKEYNGLTYEYITYDGKPFGYMISDKTKVVRIIREERRVVDSMFEYCVAHPVVETLDCETKDGMYWCRKKSEDG